MKRQLMLVLAMLLTALSSCLLTYSALAQLVTKSVGTPACRGYKDLQGNQCYEITCNPSPDDYSNYKTCDGRLVSSSLYSVNECEIPPSAGRIRNHITCTTNPNVISYSWVGSPNPDGSETEHSVTTTIICPHSCQKCAVEPNTLGMCPRGSVKNGSTGCCDRKAGLACNTVGPGGSCPTGTAFDGGNACCDVSTPTSCAAFDGTWNFASNTCNTSTPTPTPTPTSGGGCNPSYLILLWCGDYNYVTCQCDGDFNKSPIIVDVSGDGFSLTDAAGGVNFDLDAEGVIRERLSWTAAGSDDAFLFLDRNEDGVVNNGTELFGDVTPQPYSPVANGFAALGMYDDPRWGGNGDGVIDGFDTVYYSLRLWQDKNHNGVSEPDELHTLPELGVVSISLDYRESGRRDRYGNVFRYRARLNGYGQSDAGRWAYDVFLQRGQ